MIRGLMLSAGYLLTDQISSSRPATLSSTCELVEGRDIAACLTRLPALNNKLRVLRNTLPDKLRILRNAMPVNFAKQAACSVKFAAFSKNNR